MNAAIIETQRGQSLRGGVRRLSVQYADRLSRLDGSDTVVAAATYVEDHGFTPFDALHLVESNGDTVVSSDDTYEDVTPRLDLKTIGEE